MNSASCPQLPLKNVAVALLFSVFLGPIGVLYSSVLGGVTMMVIAFIVMSSHYLVPIILMWLGSCVWGVASANRYNKKLLARWIQ